MTLHFCNLDVGHPRGATVVPGPVCAGNGQKRHKHGRINHFEYKLNPGAILLES